MRVRHVEANTKNTAITTAKNACEKRHRTV
ncbi:hypothetical protein ACVWWG_000570 [Bradyrhizobium sp. LB7.2]